MLWLQLTFRGKNVNRGQNGVNAHCIDSEQIKINKSLVKLAEKNNQILHSHAIDDLESTTSSCNDSEIGTSSNYENLKSQINLQFQAQEIQNQNCPEIEFEDDSNIWQLQQHQSQNSNSNSDQEVLPVQQARNQYVENDTNESQENKKESLDFENFESNQQILTKQQRLEVLNQELPVISQQNDQKNLENQSKQSKSSQLQIENTEAVPKRWFSWGHHRRRKTAEWLSHKSEVPIQRSLSGNSVFQNSDKSDLIRNSELFSQTQNLNQQQKNQQKQTWSGFFFKPFTRVKPLDSSFIFACSQTPQELLNFADCEDFLMSMPGSAEGVAIIFQQLDEQLNSIQDDFDSFWGNQKSGDCDIQFEELLWNAQQRLHGLVLSGYSKIVEHWPQILVLSEDHCIAIQKSLQNIVLKKAQVQILEFLGKYNKCEDEEIWSFCREMSQILPQNYVHVDNDEKWCPIYYQESQAENSENCSETESSFLRQESMVVEIDQKNSGLEQQLQIRFDWEVDSSSHDYILGDFDIDVICMHTMVQYAVTEPYDPFQLICNWLENVQINAIYDDFFENENFDFVSFPFKHIALKSQVQEQKNRGSNNNQNQIAFDLNLSNSELSESFQLNSEVLVRMQDDFDLSLQNQENPENFDFQGSMDHILNMSSAECPIDMIFQISKCHQSVRNILANGGLGEGVGGQVPADEVLPVFINLVTHAQFKHLATYVQYLEFSNLIGDHLTAQAQMVCNLQMAKSYIQIKIKEAVQHQQQLLQINNSILYLSSVPYIEGEDELSFFELLRGERIKQFEQPMLYLDNDNKDDQLFDDSFDCYVKDAMAVMSSDSFTRCSVECSRDFEYSTNFVPTGCWQNQVQYQQF